jgi:hypothetical protein
VVRRAWAVPVVAHHDSFTGDEIAKSGAATMIRRRCWTMWSQNNSCW